MKYLRAGVGLWNVQNNAFEAHFNRDIFGFDDDDVSEQAETWLRSLNANVDPTVSYFLLAEDETSDRWLELNKENMLVLLRLCSILQQVFDSDVTWCEGSNQTATLGDLVDIRTLWTEESPRNTWSHGH